MAEAKTDQEPSIEEILESIRRIIAEEPAKAAAPADDGKPFVELVQQADAAAETYKSDLSLTPAPEAPQDKAVSLSLTPAASAPATPSSLDLSSAQQEKPAMPNDAAPKKDDVLDLTDKVTPAAPATAPAAAAPAPAPAQQEPPKTEKPMTAAAETSADEMLSSQAAEAATSALSKLLATNVAVEKDEPSRLGKVTLEDMTKELMKPLIKTWLDQNLPGLVEKIVQRELDKLSKRAGG